MFPWYSMGPHGGHGDPWVPMGSHGSPWVPMGPHGFPWVPMGTHGSPWGPHGVPWGPMGSPWVPMGPVLWVPMDPRMSKINDFNETHSSVRQKVGSTGSISTQNMFPLHPDTPKRPESPYGAKYIFFCRKSSFSVFRPIGPL